MTLSQRHRIRIAVSDQAGLPVAGAAVEVVQFSRPSLPPLTTTAEGTATLDIPADVEVYHILALKPGVGMDYFENFHAWPSRPLPGLPPEAHLILNGAREVSVQAVDFSGRPLPNVPWTPWTVHKRGKLTDVNCSGRKATVVYTDAGGFARFTWIPADLEDGPQFLVADRAYHCPYSPWLDLAHPDRPLVARLFHNSRVTGKVLFPDGTPAAGIALRTEGRGRTNFYCRRDARSGPDGGFEFLVYPGQSYLLAVMDDAWAAPSRRGIEVREGHPQTGIDVCLTRGVRLHGQVTLGASAASRERADNYAHPAWGGIERRLERPLQGRSVGPLGHDRRGRAVRTTGWTGPLST